MVQQGTKWEVRAHGGGGDWPPLPFDDDEVPPARTTALRPVNRALRVTCQ